MNAPIIECVPNISEGRDSAKINEIANVVETVEGVRLLNVDPGKATNRTVITFVGEPESVIEAAFRLVKKASELIDMSKHSGEHPRFGATDVCPLVPVANCTLEELVPYAHKLGKRIGNELGIPIYFYEKAATEQKRQNLATVRAGEYEGLKEKLVNPDWKPDAGPAEFNEQAKKSGTTAVSVRDFLVAYNINLNTTSTRRANAIAFDIRERGRVKRDGNPLTGKIVKDENGEPINIPGKLKHVKGIGWFIEEYGVAQISYNLTNINETPLHIAFDETCNSAQSRGLRVTGSELVGLVPKKVLVDAGKFFLSQQQRSHGIPDDEIIRIAIKSLGLDELGPFDPKERIIEYMINDQADEQLVDKTLTEFAHETASESPAPGGGSIAAYVGALGAGLDTMVANLSAHKRGWDDRWEYYSTWAKKGQQYTDDLLKLVDKDTLAFNKIMDAFGLPKNTEEDKAARASAIEEATKNACLIPLEVMQRTYDSMEVAVAMANDGLKASVSDAGVGALCARAAVYGAFLNVKINAKELSDKEWAENIVSKAQGVLNNTIDKERSILEVVEGKI